MEEIYHGIPEYIPEICSHAKREENHFECTKPCTQIHQKKQYICPCFGKDGGGWIEVSDTAIKELTEKVKRWNQCRSRLSYKDAYTLEEINHFRVNKFELIIDEFGEDDAEQVKKELLTLLNNGDKVSFNEEWGVGQIERNSDGTFTVTKWYYHEESTPVLNGTIEDVLKFLWNFWEQSEPFSYAKAGHPELER